jgi:hypothetical protein
MKTPRALLLVRPEEFNWIQPEQVIYLPSGEAIWKWVRWESPRAGGQ